MSKVLVIPDVHLRTWMFDRAEKILGSGQADFAVQLGDLVDDWDMQFAIAFYEKTVKRAIAFHEKFPKTRWCMGNHDFGYYLPEYGRKETGHSRLLEENMSKWLADDMYKTGIKQEIVHIIDNVIFSHAGVTENYVKRQVPDKSKWEEDETFVYNLLNDSPPAPLWESDSPIWARPQGDYSEKTGERLPHTFLGKMWKADKYMQVVGHTPMRKIIQFDNFLSTDVFSTYNNGAPYGEQKFAIVDTVNKTWQYAEEEE